MFNEPNQSNKNTPFESISSNQGRPQPEIMPTRSRGGRLTDQQIDALSRDLLGAYAGGFMHSESAVATRTEEFLEDLRKHLKSSQRVVVAHEGNRRAVLCGSVGDCGIGRIYLLGGLLIEPGLQHRGLGSALLQRELIETKAQMLAFHTQSKIMEGLGRKYADINLMSSRLIAQYLPDHHVNLDHNTCIDRGRYGGKPLYGDLERLREIAIPDIDVDKGDARFFAGVIRNPFVGDSL